MLSRPDARAGRGRGLSRSPVAEPDGKRMVPAADWARGARPGDDDRLGA